MGQRGPNPCVYDEIKNETIAVSKSSAITVDTMCPLPQWGAKLCPIMAVFMGMTTDTAIESPKRITRLRLVFVRSLVSLKAAAKISDSGANVLAKSNVRPIALTADEAACHRPKNGTYNLTVSLKTARINSKRYTISVDCVFSNSININRDAAAT